MKTTLKVMLPLIIIAALMGGGGLMLPAVSAHPPSACPSPEPGVNASKIIYVGYFTRGASAGELYVRRETWEEALEAVRGQLLPADHLDSLAVYVELDKPKISKVTSGGDGGGGR